MRCEVEHKIFSAPAEEFEAHALEVFRFQYQHNPIYQQYVNALAISPDVVRQVSEIPFLPVSFFDRSDNSNPPSYPPRDFALRVLH